MRKNKILYTTYTYKELIFKIHLKTWIFSKDLVYKWSPIKYEYFFHPWINRSLYISLNIEYLLSPEFKKSSRCFKVEHKSNVLKVGEIPSSLWAVIQALDFDHIFYLIFLFSTCDIWFPVQLFPPFVRKYFPLTIHHSEKGMSLNCQLVLCSDKRHSSVSRLYVRNLEINTVLSKMNLFHKWYFRK